MTAAAALSANIIEEVRTVNNDEGEVAVAAELLRIAGAPAGHRVTEVFDPGLPGGDIRARYQSLHRAWEGNYNARSAYRGKPFAGFSSPAAPSINGLGGGAMQGNNTVKPEVWAQYAGASPEAGHERILKMLAGGPAITREASTRVKQEMDFYPEWTDRLGIPSAHGVFDHFHAFFKIPYWSLPQAHPHILVPFFAPTFIRLIIWAIKQPQVPGRMHQEILQELRPDWADVPFYKGTPRSRAMPWMWENDGWAEAKELISAGASALDNFEPTRVDKMLSDTESGDASLAHEITFNRIVWESSFDDYLADLTNAVRRTRHELSLARRV